MTKKILLIVFVLAAFVGGAAQCRATTKKGAQCKRQAVAGTQFCWQHGGKSQAAQKVVTAEQGSAGTPVSSSSAEAISSAPSATVGGNDSDKDLNKENEALRRENQKLRRELVRQKEGEPVIDMSEKSANGTRKAAPAERIVDDGGWWLSSSGKRHNSKCRYYKTGKGHPCNKDAGTPCKKCGG